MKTISRRRFVRTSTLAVAGFWGMVLLVRRLGAPVAVGAVVAFVFSFGVVPEFKLGHAQTYTMQLAPVLGLMLVSVGTKSSCLRAARVTTCHRTGRRTTR